MQIKTYDNPQHPVAFILANTKNGTMILNRNDSALNPHGYDYGMGNILLNKGRANLDFMGLIEDVFAILAKSNERILALDCGANIGTLTIPMAVSLSKYNGFIIAFEPQEWLFYALCGNLAINNCFNVRPLHMGLSHENKVDSWQTPHPLHPASFGSWGLREDINKDAYGEKSVKRTEQITIKRLDSIALGRPINFIKLDIEGEEQAFLKGAEETIKRDQPVILLEILKSNKKSIFEQLDQLGYYCGRLYNKADALAWPKENKALDAEIRKLVVPDDDTEA